MGASCADLASSQRQDRENHTSVSSLSPSAYISVTALAPAIKQLCVNSLWQRWEHHSGPCEAFLILSLSLMAQMQPSSGWIDMDLYKIDLQLWDLPTGARHYIIQK